MLSNYVYIILTYSDGSGVFLAKAQSLFGFGHGFDGLGELSQVFFRWWKLGVTD
jgi:hypothetical protein